MREATDFWYLALLDCFQMLTRSSGERVRNRSRNSLFSAPSCFCSASISRASWRPGVVSCGSEYPPAGNACAGVDSAWDSMLAAKTINPRGNLVVMGTSRLNTNRRRKHNLRGSIGRVARTYPLSFLTDHVGGRIPLAQLTGPLEYNGLDLGIDAGAPVSLSLRHVRDTRPIFPCQKA